MVKNKMELMAPVGSYESLMGAIQGGADSIYFGASQLNMRNKSSANFTLDDLAKISKICKHHKIKCYLTLNTIVYDEDTALMKEIISAAKTRSIDAVIASDHAVMNFAKKSGIVVHISTQCNITNIDTVEFYSSYADVMVMARELTLEQVAEISKEIEKRNITGPSGNLVRLEVFGHGALCMSISGKCYLSLHSNNVSANRGACIQNCRRDYIVTDKSGNNEYEIGSEYIMSAKDLCTIDFLDQIITAGVSVLKIEGRGRSVDYVYTVTKCYREAIDAYYLGEYSRDKFENWKERLSTVFNRGFWDGYYLGRTMGEWSNVYGSKATQKKVQIGKVTNYYHKIKVGEFLLESDTLSVGDEILITGTTTGILQTTVHELQVSGVLADKVTKGQPFTISIERKVRLSDKLFKLVSS